MKSLVYLVLVIFCFIIQLPVKALAEVVVNCKTTQAYTWPMKDPNGLPVSKVASISIDWPVSGTSETAKGRSAQVAWKSCRRNLGDQFRNHWSQLGFPLQLPQDEFGRLRMPRMCEDYHDRPDLYTCFVVER